MPNHRGSNLQDDFRKLSNDLDGVAAGFYEHLFANAPETARLFEGVDMERLGQMVFQALGLVVYAPDRVDELSPVLEDLGHRHASYGVRAEHYPLAVDAFVAAFRNFLGADFTDASEVAWREALRRVSDAMVQGSLNVREQMRHRPLLGGKSIAPRHKDDYLARFLAAEEDGAARTASLTSVLDATRFEVDFEGDRAVEAAPLQTLLQVALRNGIPHVCECGGRARCSTCRVVVLGGNEHCLPRNRLECKMATLKGFPPEVRLACQTRITGPVRVRRLVFDAIDASQASAAGIHSTGRETELAVMFADIRDFTRLSSRNLPYDIIHALNRYFGIVCEEIDRELGYVDKYIGDGLMALFGLDAQRASNPCVDAVRAAVAMQGRMSELNAYLTEHLQMEFRTGIGIHFGRVVVGELGFRLKKQFTAVGDVVNTSSRIEGKTKELGAAILVSDAVRERLPAGEFALGPATEVLLAGKDHPVVVHPIRI